VQRFFVEGVHSSGDVVALGGSDARKIVTVLRKRSGDRIQIVDSAAAVFTAEIEVEAGTQVRARLLAPQTNAPPGGPRLTIAQAIPKGQKMDFVVEKLTELGVAAIVPFESERSVVTGIGPGKLERWRRLAKSASQQSGRRDVPEIAAPTQLSALMESFTAFDCVLFPWELAARAGGSVGGEVALLVRGAAEILGVIGPEGGFSHAEASAAHAAGAHFVSLGDRIFRTETAGLVLATLVQFSQP